MSRHRRRSRIGTPFGRIRPTLLAGALLAAVVVGSVLALGSVHVEVLLGVAVLASLAALVVIAAGILPGSKVPAPAWIVVGLVLYTALQAAPMPRGLLAFLAPENADVWARVFRPLGEEGPAWASLSLDPGASWVEALKGWTYLAVFVTAASVGARRGASFGALLLLASATLVACTTLAHDLLDAKRVFGLYEPRFVNRGVGPLINQNNIAGYLNLGVLSGAALLAAERPAVPRWAIGLLVAFNATMSLMTGSRAGAASLLAGVALLVWTLRRARSPEHDSRLLSPRFLVGVGLALALCVALTAIAGGNRVARLLLDDNVSKLEVIRDSVAMIRDHGWFGVGRGAYEGVLPAYRPGADNTIASHPENFLVQWASEWGIPATLALLAAGAWLLRPRVWGIASSAAACGLFSGFAALLLQNLLDLGLEVPGLAIAASAAAGTAWGATLARSSAEPMPPRVRAGAAVAVAFATGLICFTAASRGRPPLTLERDMVRAAVPSDPRAPGAWEAFRDRIRTAMSRHPAEPYFPRLTAFVAWQTGRQNPLPWINRALERGTSAGRTHYLLGAYLASRGKQHQALLELRLAAQYDHALSRGAARIATSVTQDKAALLRAVPDGSAGTTMLLAMSGKGLTEKHAELKDDLLREAIVREPSQTEARSRLLRRLIERLEIDKPASGCAGDLRARCETEAERLARELGAMVPDADDAALLRARLLLATAHPKEALAVLKPRCAHASGRLACFRLWTQAAVALGQTSELSAIAKAVESEGCAEGTCPALFAALAEGAKALGDSVGALDYLERAATEEASPKRWRQVARVAEAAGEHARAIRALDRAAALDPGDRGLRRLPKRPREADTAAP